MRQRPLISRCIAFFLLLVFIQKAGAGLFVHNIIHQTGSTKNSGLPSNEKNKEAGYSCSCIDDFMMPFAEADPISIPAPAISTLTYFIAPADAAVFSATVHSFLRGPPVHLA